MVIAGVSLATAELMRLALPNKAATLSAQIRDKGERLINNGLQAANCITHRWIMFQLGRAARYGESADAAGRATQTVGKPPSFVAMGAADRFANSRSLLPEKGKNFLFKASVTQRLTREIHEIDRPIARRCRSVHARLASK
jgi:hypothetical protein